MHAGAIGRGSALIGQIVSGLFARNFFLLSSFAFSRFTAAWRAGRTLSFGSRSARAAHARRSRSAIVSVDRSNVCVRRIGSGRGLRIKCCFRRGHRTAFIIRHDHIGQALIVRIVIALDAGARLALTFGALLIAVICAILAVLPVLAIMVAAFIAFAIAVLPALVTVLALMAIPVSMAIAVLVIAAVAIAPIALTFVRTLLGIVVTVIAMRVLLALAFGHFALRLAQHTGVMLGMLQEALFGNAVVRQLGVACQSQIFFNNLLWRATHFAFGPRRIEDAVNDIAQGTLAVRLVARTGFG